ncbi:MAG TPA: alpha/beta fold hydrolase [Solirubrobacteraceae bacterium]|nr:alpha/beta fold hydrolase [Solirubrobacteraceae bacterium]
MRSVTEAMPSKIAAHDGLAYSLWLPRPETALKGGVVILHGADSCKESHHDYARLVLAAGFAAIAFDQRGHGASAGPLDTRVIDDSARMAELLRAKAGDPELPLALRGSSMGGYLAIVAAAPARAQAVVAICPASASGLRRGLASGRFEFDVDADALDLLLAANDESAALAALAIPVLLLHAEGDERVPVQHSRELAARFATPRSRLITVPGGHHRSVQHDGELQAVSLRFIEQALAR